jgi:hypothetical protein
MTLKIITCALLAVVSFSSSFPTRTGLVSHLVLVTVICVVVASSGRVALVVVPASATVVTVFTPTARRFLHE